MRDTQLSRALTLLILLTTLRRGYIYKKEKAAQKRSVILQLETQEDRKEKDGCQGSGGNGSQCLMGKMERVMETDGGDGSPAL